MSVLHDQYDLVRRTRQRLFLYCEEIAEDDYAREIDGFVWGSIRNLHAHMASCYQAWLAHYALEKDIPIVKAEDIANLTEIKRLYEEVDEIVAEFLDAFGDRPNERIRRSYPGYEKSEVLSVLWLFTQTITHEFHHKGQIVLMGRQLGYVPIDTDLATSDGMVRL